MGAFLFLSPLHPHSISSRCLLLFPHGPRDGKLLLISDRSHKSFKDLWQSHNCSILGFLFNFLNLFIWLSQILVVACGMWFPNQGQNLGPQLWEHGSQPLNHQGSPTESDFSRVFKIVKKTNGSDYSTWLRKESADEGQSRGCSNHGSGCEQPTDGYTEMATLTIIDLSLSDLLKRNSSNLFVPVSYIFSQHRRDNDTLHNGQVLFY